jgi:hypothetical protein
MDLRIGPRVRGRPISCCLSRAFGRLEGAGPWGFGCSIPLLLAGARGHAVRTPVAPRLNRRRETDSPIGGRASPGFSGDRRWHSDCPCSEQPCSKEGQAAGPGGSWRDFRSGRITLCAALAGWTWAVTHPGLPRIWTCGLPHPARRGARPVPFPARARLRTRFARDLPALLPRASLPLSKPGWFLSPRYRIFIAGSPRSW